MTYALIKDVIQLIEEFDSIADGLDYSKDLKGFRRWIGDSQEESNFCEEPQWEGKENGRSPESVISTLIVHMNRYAKTYSRSAIHESGISTQEDFIYLINLRAFGAMTKTDLIKKNIHDKPVGMQIINRLVRQGWVQQKDSVEDKRSKIVFITPEGLKILDQSMEKIRQATEVVSGNLLYPEKVRLIKLLQKLENFHHPIYSRNLDPSQLVETAYKQYLYHGN